VRLVTGHTQIDCASWTDVGIRRSHNQDSYAVLPAGDADQWRQRGHVFLVADGMGAHAVGELASKLAADSIPHIYTKYAHEGPVTALRKAFIETNLTIHSRGQQNREFEGMGTTGTALLLRPEGAWVAHVGDSRVYRVRGQRIEQLSFDHSLVWELARRQRVSPEELQGIPSNVIVRSLGPEPLVQVDIEGPHPVQAGDIFVLCSDGLSGQLPDREIGAVVRALPPAEACRLLVDMANLHGGPDNITAIVVRVTEDGDDAAGARGRRRGASWHDRLPWPLLCLLLGILLAFFALGLTSSGLPGKWPAFFLAAVALLCGLAGLIIQHRREENGAVAEEVPRPKVYRAADCAIDEPLVQKMARAAVALEGRLREHQGDADWSAFQGHQEQAQKCQGRGELTEAFREYCRAVRVLAEAWQRQRGREEQFQPLWDRSPR
jgi:protein phosphatase